MDPSRTLEQFQQAAKFHTENDAVSLYDLISVSDFEDTRVLVRLSMLNNLNASDGIVKVSALDRSS